MEAATLNCQSCGAAVGPNDLQCPYCKSQLATVACPQCLGMVSVHAQHCPRCGAGIRREAPVAGDLACPVCKAKLFRSAVGTAALDQCHQCGGVWVAREAFQHLVSDREGRGGVLGALPGEAPRDALAPGEIRYRPCPVCAKFMNRVNFARTSGVILDACKDHGLWFDQDELRRVLQFIEAGGLEKARVRELMQQDEQRRMMAALAAVEAMGPQTGTGFESSRPGPADGLIETLVRGLFGF